MKISDAINDFVTYQFSRRGDDRSTAKGYKTTLNQFLRLTGDKECVRLRPPLNYRSYETNKG